jgi:hypothetical protein
MASDFVTPEGILSGHLRATVRRSDERPVILVPQDTSEVDLTRLRETTGLGPIGNGKGRGFLFHTALAISADPEHQVLGVLHQRTWVRPTAPSKRRSLTPGERKRQPNRESQKWLETARAAHNAVMQRPEVATLAKPPRLIHLSDREGDIFDYFHLIDELGDSCVIRLVQNRRLADEPGGEPGEDLDPKLMGRIRQSAVVATATVAVKASKQHTEHLAKVELRATTMTLLAPAKSKLPPLEVNVVEVWEPSPPEGSKPLRWCLLTREPITTAEEVETVVEHYRARWLIEEFHKGLKSGCSLEAHQFGDVRSFLHFLALASIATCCLLAVRAAARQARVVMGSEVVTEVQLEVLRGLRPKLPKEPTVREVMREVACLGGFLGRKGDGEPGWQTMWKGWRELRTAERGWRVAKGLPPDPTALDFSPLAGFG